MDPIRKIVSGRLRVQTSGPHPDADVLSAFAERALPEIERTQVLAHLAECTDCRQIVFFALPDSEEPQKVLLAKDRAVSTQFALRWGTLAVAIAVAAFLVVSIRHHGAVSVYQQAAPVKGPGQMAAELKTPADVAEMRVLRDNRASRTTTGLAYSEKKAIPAPKHMTAKPAGKFDFDESGQVRMAPRSEDAELDKLQANAKSFGALGKLEPAPASTAPAVSPHVSGGLIQANGNKPAYSVTGQGQTALAKLAVGQGNLDGTVFDPSGAVIPNATVSMNGLASSRIARSDPAGKFSFDHLVPGSYTVKAAAPGFKATEVQQVSVLVNKDSNLRLTLEPGTASEAVEVSAATRSSTSTSEVANAEVEVTATAPAVESTGAAVAQNAKQTNAVARQNSVAQNSESLGTAGLLSSLPQWTLSAKGRVQRSLDAGRTWQIVPVAKAAFRSLCSVGTHVWVGGKAGVLYHSADSGLTWTRLTLASSGHKLGADINQVNFSDPLNGEVGTVNSELWTTSDGGQTWNVQQRF